MLPTIPPTFKSYEMAKEWKRELAKRGGFIPPLNGPKRHRSIKVREPTSTYDSDGECKGYIMWDFRPNIRPVLVRVNQVEAGVEPNAWVVLTYAFLCSIGYGRFEVVGVPFLVELYRLLFGFHPLAVVASLPSGATNYPMAILTSIVSVIHPTLSFQTAFFVVGPQTFQYFLSKRAQILDRFPRAGIASRIWDAFRFTKRLVFVLLLIYVLLYSTSLILAQRQILLPTSHDMSEKGSGSESLSISFSASVSAKVIHANKTLHDVVPATDTLTAKSSTSQGVNHATDEPRGHSNERPCFNRAFDLAKR